MGTLAAADSISLCLRLRAPPCSSVLLRAPPPRPGKLGKVPCLAEYSDRVRSTAQSDPLPSLTEIPTRRFWRVALRRVAFMLALLLRLPASFIYLPWPATTSFAPLLPEVGRHLFRASRSRWTSHSRRSLINTHFPSNPPFLSPATCTKRSERYTALAFSSL